MAFTAQEIQALATFFAGRECTHQSMMLGMPSGSPTRLPETANDYFKARRALLGDIGGWMTVDECITHLSSKYGVKL